MVLIWKAWLTSSPILEGGELWEKLCLEWQVLVKQFRRDTDAWLAAQEVFASGCMGQCMPSPY